MEGVCMLLVLLLGSITAEAQLSFSNSLLSATVLEGGEQVCPAEEQLETARAAINQDVRALLRPYLGTYIDCRDAYEQGLTQSGVYNIQPDSKPAFEAYCDMTTDGGGWTTFQRRQDGSQDFFLYWTDYENGFGNISNEFWLGLAHMHRLTASTARTELRVDLEDFSLNTRYAQYTDFGIGDASTNYVLTVAGYSGTAGDALTQHNNFPFSTRDRDNDNSRGNCAQSYTGAWWFTSCFHAHLNGLYNNIHWNGLKVFSEMKLRRA